MRGAPPTVTVLMGRLTGSATAKGGRRCQKGDWNTKVDCDSAHREVAKLTSLKTPNVANVIRLIEAAEYRLD